MIVPFRPSSARGDSSCGVAVRDAGQTTGPRGRTTVPHPVIQAFSSLLPAWTRPAGQVRTPECRGLVEQRARSARDAEPGEGGSFGGELLAGQPLYTHAVAVRLRQP